MLPALAFLCSSLLVLSVLHLKLKCQIFSNTGCFCRFLGALFHCFQYFPVVGELSQTDTVEKTLVIAGFVTKLGCIPRSQVTCLPWPNVSPSLNDTCTYCYCWHLISKWWKPQCPGEKGAVTASTMSLSESPGQHDPGPCQGQVCQRARAKSGSSAAAPWIPVESSWSLTIFKFSEHTKELTGVWWQDHSLWETVWQGNGTGSPPAGGFPWMWGTRRKIICKPLLLRWCLFVF